MQCLTSQARPVRFTWRSMSRQPYLQVRSGGYHSQAAGRRHLPRHPADTIRSATKNNSLKLSSVSYLFNESEWSQYVRNVNNTTTNTKLQIGTDSQNARYVYVMVNGVTTKTTDPSNPRPAIPPSWVLQQQSWP